MHLLHVHVILGNLGLGQVENKLRKYSIGQIKCAFFRNQK